ncbi:MAG: sugar kinase [Bacillota bacterium]|nr:sugar kinase [Bacillota bacterium]
MMDRISERKIIIIKRKTRLEELVARYNTVSQAKFYIEHLGADFSDYINENENYKNAVNEAFEILSYFGRVQILDREYVPNYIFGNEDLVVVIGQDGLVANTLKYLTNQLLIGVNPDSKRWEGVLLPFTVSDLKFVVADVLNKKMKVKEVTMAKATLNDGQVIYGVNDLFIGQKTHISARYHLYHGNYNEEQSSSGIIISTGLGSTGWLKSILSGAFNIVNTIYKNSNLSRDNTKINWDVNYLYYSIREPFPSRNTKANLVFGKISKDKPLKVLSSMTENGVIFSDGIEDDFLQFNSGIEASITVAEKKGHLVT